MIGLSSLSPGSTSSYGTFKKNYSSYGLAFHYGYGLFNYPNTQDPALCYLFEDVTINYLKIDDKVILPNNSYYSIYTFDSLLEDAYYRDDGYGLGSVGSIDAINSYIKDTVKNNDFTFYPAPYNMILRASIGRKMIISISSYIYQIDDGVLFFDGNKDWTLYINYPYSSIDRSPRMLEKASPLESFNGYTSSIEGIGNNFYWS
jgi:hypothetical protein